MLKAVIFDMDGVIIDSEPMHFMIDKKLLGSLGVEADERLLSRYVGVSNPEMLADIRKRFRLDFSINELLELKNKLLLEALSETNLQPVRGVRELILDLVSHNVLLAVASSSPKMFVETVLKKLGLQQYFKVVVSGEELEKSKPAPDIFIKAASLLNVRPDECVVIEDSTPGTEAAEKAGIRCVGYLNPNSGRQDLSKASVTTDDMRKLNYEILCSITV